MSTHEEQKAAANALVSLPQYKIDRLKRELAKARAQRNRWRDRAEMAERTLRDGVSEHEYKLHKQQLDAQALKHGSLENEVRQLKSIITDKIIEKLRTAK